MNWFLIGWALYALIGMCLIPRFARDSYAVQKAQWSHQSDQESLATGAWMGWLKSLIWPVWIGISIAIGMITAEKRAAEAERNRQKSVEEARAIIALDAAKQKREWEREFRG